MCATSCYIHDVVVEFACSFVEAIIELHSGHADFLQPAALWIEIYPVKHFYIDQS